MKQLLKFLPLLPWVLFVLLVGAVIIALTTRAHGQLGGVQQPIFGNLASPTFTPETLTNLGWYWNYTDLADGEVSTWTDRIQGATLNQSVAGQRPSKDATGVAFFGTDVLTNTTVHAQFNTANGATWWVIVYRTNYDDPPMTEMIDALAGSGTSGWRLENTGMFWSTGSLGKNGGSGNVYRDFLIVDSTGPPTPGQGYTNNVIMSGSFSGGDYGTGFALGNRSPAGAYPFKGYIAEVGFFTNVVSELQRSNLHWYATNTYSFSP